MTTDVQGAARAMGATIVGLASHRASTPASLARVLGLDPGLVEAHVLAGFAAKLLARSDRVERALASAIQARRHLEERGGTERETWLVTALERWCALDPEGAVSALDRVLEDEPLDLMAMKLSHALQFMLGHTNGLRRSIERVLPAWRSVGGSGEGLVHGCWAFTLVETGELERAEQIGRAAIERSSLDPWGVHAVAHVLHAQARWTEALRWLDDNAACLDGANNFAAHVHWHRAVVLVALGRLDEALSLHDRAVVVEGSIDYRDFVNRATLLYRVERAGLGVGDRWERLADLARERRGDHTLAFADAHYVLALAKAGRSEDAARFVASMREHAERSGGTQAATQRELGVPIADALASLRSAPRRTVDLLDRRASELPRLGGSRPQREIFALVREDAASECTPPCLIGRA